MSPPLPDQALTRAAGASLVPGNAVRLLKDAAEHYPAWLLAVRGAREQVHLECYILADDPVGREFAEALAAKAREGVRVRVVYDWMGALGRAGRRFWRGLREAGVEVRCFNPPRLGAPLDWLRRDHRKSLVVDGRIAYVTGLCIAKEWAGDPARGLEPWRDTGVEIRGPAVVDVAQAFADAWAETGPPLPARDAPAPPPPPEGSVALRVVAGTSFSTGAFRLDTLVATLARRRLWLADAYFAGTATYVQALRAAAHDGVDVRLLVPGAGSDIALVQAFSRAGYRTLLEGGVRVFEWNGPMMHAKTAVADGHWARVGSTNLNVASWLGNWELDAIVEDDAFGQAMEEMYEQDLANATEVVLGAGRLLPGGRRLVPVSPPPRQRRRATGSGPRAAAGAVRIGYSIGAAVTSRRALGPAEASLSGRAGVLLVLLAGVTLVFPLVTAVPLAAIAAWVGLSLLARAWRLRRAGVQALPGAAPREERGKDVADRRDGAA
ncbi:MAG TPA: phospholipase D-like domain-containing protein [Vicinamibacteria bacterium]|nr:phospholipase D-like domain-containing protein [Vicinamibacteria bacterium]